MLRPEEMTRAVVVGSIDSLDATIDCLYELGVLHLIDFTSQDEDFKIGQPLPKASGASQKLLKLRAMIRSLEIEKHKPSDRMPVSDINKRLEQAFVTLDLNTSSKAEARQKIQNLIREKEAEINALEPFASFGVKVEDYEGYDNIIAFTGTCKRDPEDSLSKKLQEHEILELSRKTDIVVAVFVRNEDRMEAARILSEHDFQEIKLPKLKGGPGGGPEEGRVGPRRNQEAVRGLHRLFGGAPCDRGAEGRNTPPDRHIGQLVRDGRMDTHRPGGRDTDRPRLPVLRARIRGEEPFEFFINLVSTPKYEEIDPTLVLFITFPLFFGFMIGDLGFGLGLMALGAVMRWKLKGSPDLYKLGTIVLVGGLMASIFGVFVFAEAFGVPFHPPEAAHDEASWEAVGNIPIHPLLDKMHDTKEMLGISLFAGWIHLTLGLVFGFANHYHHNRKHALGKIAWIVILFGLFEEMMVIAGNATETSAFVNATVYGFMPDSALSLIGVEISIPAVVLILVGVVALPFTEGPLALTEVIGLFTNLVSYARLAALAVGKGAMALAFNSMLFPLIFDSGNVAIVIMGILALFVTQMFFVFFLGALSAGIQAIRLNYVEFFLKFFEGGGTDFQPLSYERKHSVATK